MYEKDEENNGWNDDDIEIAGKDVLQEDLQVYTTPRVLYPSLDITKVVEDVWTMRGPSFANVKDKRGSRGHSLDHGNKFRPIIVEFNLPFGLKRQR